jgi:hypothetical protein
MFILNGGSVNYGGDDLTVTYKLEMNGPSLLFSSNLRINGSLYLNAGTLTLSGSDRTIGGDLYFNGGEIDINSRRLTISGNSYLNGGSFTNSSSSDEIRFTNVAVNFTGAMNIPSDILMVVSSGITFVNGVLDIDNRLDINDNAVALGASDLSHVTGVVRKIGNDAFTFPLGDGTNYAPISIASHSSTSTSQHFTATYNNFAHSSTTMSGDLDHVSETEHWILDRTAGSSSLVVTLSFKNPRSGLIQNLNDLRVARYNGSSWESHGGSASGDVYNGTVTSTTISSFSPFTLGSSTTLNPLPVSRRCRFRTCPRHDGRGHVRVSVPRARDA